MQKEDPVAIVKEMTGGIGADLVVELSGSPTAISQGLRMVRTHGRFLAIGIPVEQEVSLPWKEIIFKAPSADLSLQFLLFQLGEGSLASGAIKKWM